MGSKVFLVLGLLMAIVLLISSEVAARDLAETSTDLNQNAEEANGFDDAKDGGYGGYPGGRGGYGGYPGGGRGGYGGYPGGGRGGYGGYPGGGRGGYGGGHCRYGCCGRGYYGGGCRCCSYAGEAVEANTEDKPQN
ncbi:Glycine-rich protein [Melia azedarach]|uniref:Glycine-rich protein n=1 Tax=Melia azedarach TaxID=155640 RepID=A0ACC1XRQ2_MELAZ|nr:Glycine-rich protein [Melia azedarach]